jgi:hypothetical protein
MKEILLGAAIAISALVTTPAAVQAHHGVSGQFDLSQTTVKTGVVTRVRFANPHSYVYFDSVNEAGETEAWRCELRSGSLLRRKGWDADMFAEGTEVRIFGSPAREEPTTCYTETITFADGDVLYRYGGVADDGSFINDADAIAASANHEEEQASLDVPDLSGEWGEPVASGPPAPYAGRGGPFEPSEAALAVAGNWTSEDNPRFQCKPTNIILDYRFDQMVNKIAQTDDEITLTYGFMDVVRTIHIDGAFPDDITPSLEGYSVGTWNEGKLEVTTKGFTPGFLAVIGGRSQSSLPHSDEMEITEVFYIDDAGELVREYTINEPVYLAAPYSHFDKSVRQDGQYFPFGCDDLTEEAEFAQ